MITFLSLVLITGLSNVAPDDYADRKNRITYNTKFADGIQNLLAQAENGSDRQLAPSTSISNLLVRTNLFPCFS